MPKNSRSPQSGLVWETVSLPIRGGADLRSNDRARPVGRLAKVLNGSFDERLSVTKRRGHSGARVRTEEAYFPSPAIDTRWVYGVGACNPETPTDPLTGPVQRHLRGAAVLGTETASVEAVWTGDRLYTHDSARDSWVSGGKQDPYWEAEDVLAGAGTPLYLPAGPVEDVRINNRNVTRDHTAAEGRDYLLTAWRQVVDVFVTVTTRAGAVVVENLRVSAGAPLGGGPAYGAGISLKWLKAYALDGRLAVVWFSDGNVYMAHADESAPAAWFQEILVATAAQHYDVAKTADDRALVVWRTADPGVIFGSYFDGTGVVSVPAPSGFTLVATGATGPVAAAVHPVTGNIGLVWSAGTTARCGVFAPNGDTLMNQEFHATGTPPSQCACAARSVATSPNLFAGFVDYDAGTDDKSTHCGGFDAIGGPTAEVYDRANCRLASAAFAVGQEVFVVLKTHTVGAIVQHTYALMPGISGVGLPAGVWGRSTALAFVAGDVPRSVDFVPGQDQTNRTRWCGGFTHTPRYVLRLDQPPDANVVFSEKRALRVRLDFLPPLRHAQLGRSLYFAGAAVKQWDGGRVSDAGFFQWPEYSVQPEQAGDGIITAGTRRYRVYYARRNRHGEVTRSPAITSAAVVIAENKEITFTTAPKGTFSTDDDGYHEVYRTVDSGTTFYLVAGYEGSHDSYTRIGDGLTYVDNLPDASLVNNPIDPHNPNPGALSELEETSPPGCEIIAAVEDRLWFAGGVVPVGTAAYTKRHEPGETAGWNDMGVLVYQPDVRHVPITAVAALSGGVALFRADEVMHLTGPGPDNFGQGEYSPVRRIPSDGGALVPEGTVHLPDGIAFWSVDGPRILTSQGIVTTIGDEIAPVARGRLPLAAVLVPRTSQVRWYLDDGTVLVYDYAVRQWATANNIRAIHAGYSPRVGGAFVVRANGIAMFEDDIYADAGRPYEFAIRTAELRPSELLQGSNRARRWAATGEWRGPHRLRVTAYNDGSPMPREHYTWDVGSDLDNSAFGTAPGDWGTAGDSMWPS